MIKKIFRLKEKEVKKVLRKRKPFFSYNIVLNYFPNKLTYNRYSIVIGSKSVNTNVERVYFRRRFYGIVQSFILDTRVVKGLDLVFVVKKQTKLDKKDEKCINSFTKDIKFLNKKTGKKY